VSSHAVDQHRAGSDLLDRIRAGDERHARNEDLVARPHAERAQAQDQAGRARRHAAHVLDAHILLEHPFEPLDLGAGADPRRAQRVDHLVDLLLPDQGTAEDEEALSHAEESVSRVGPAEPPTRSANPVLTPRQGSAYKRRL